MITIALDDDAVNAALLRASAAVGDISPLLADIGAYLVQSMQDRLKAGQTPDGKPFAPRAPATVARYDRQGERYGGVLWKSGSLHNQIFASVSGQELTIASPMAYAAMMHFGGSKERWPHLWGDIPARPFLGISEEDRSAILDEVAEWIGGAVAGTP
jgi:phage virion morphogenesis protein